MSATPKKALTRQQKAAAVIIIAVTLLIVYALTAVAVIPLKYDIKAGQVSTVNIIAPIDVEDKVTTETDKAQARAAVEPVYAIDETKTNETAQNISAFFDSAAQAAEYIKNAYISDRILVTGLTQEYLLNSYDPAAVDWESFLTPEIISHVKTMMGDESMPDDAVYALASKTPEDIEGIRVSIVQMVSVSLGGGIMPMPERLQAEKGGIKNQIDNLYEDAGIRYIALLPVNKFLEANLVYDTAATNAALETAENSVKPTIYMKNQAIVKQNEVVTDAQFAVLQNLGLVGSEEQDYTLYVGMFIFVALLFVIYAIYLFQFESEVISEIRKLVLIMGITAVTAAIAVPLVKLDTRIITAFFGTMLVSVLVSQRSALSLNVFLAFIIGAICSCKTGLLSPVMLRTVMIIIISGSAAVFTLYKPGYRASLIYAGLIAGGLGAGISALMNTIWAVGAASESIILDAVFVAGSGLLGGGVLTIGTLPIWEAMFRVSTPAKLIELSDPNHPLLKRLTVEAPGTYHHSILTANLAEAGADAVGANALLCRVGAYYHDVGKLKNPEYFKENQKKENPHDSLDPRESARIITDHLIYGMELAQRYKLPRDVQKIMAQHHGDSCVPFFLHKAQEAGIDTNDTVFKYKGSKPSTKESAVVMLSDCVEAAVKSIDEPDREQVKEMISNIIRNKYNEGQFDECPIGRRDLNALAKAFIGVYDGAFHERIKYPGQE